MVCVIALEGVIPEWGTRRLVWVGRDNAALTELASSQEYFLEKRADSHSGSPGASCPDCSFRGSHARRETSLKRMCWARFGDHRFFGVDTLRVRIRLITPSTKIKASI